MKTIKPLFTVILGLFFALSFSSTQAQDKSEMLKQSTPEQRATMQTGMMRTKLNLDSAQVTKVQAINLKYAQKLDPVLKGDDRPLKKAMAMRSIQKDKDAELKKVLTDEQNKKYDEMKEEMKEKIKEMKANKP